VNAENALQAASAIKGRLSKARPVLRLEIAISGISTSAAPVITSPGQRLLRPSPADYVIVTN